MTIDRQGALVLRDARVGSAIVDLLVDRGVIVDIVPAGSELRGVDGKAEEVPLEGRWLGPGLWDNHVHFGQWSLLRQRIDVSGATSAREAAAIVSAALVGSEHNPFVGVGFRGGLWPDEPGLEILDPATGVVPVVLISADLHAVWLNSAALARFGHTGHPTGLLREESAFEVIRRLDTAVEGQLDVWADAAAREAARRGVVGIVDLEMDWNLDTWNRRIAAGTGSLRVEFGIYPHDLDRAIALGLRTGQRIGDLLTVGPFKVITDGSLNTRTAYCFDAYPGLTGPDSHGLLAVQTDELEQLIRRATDAGLTPAVHAIGDRANSIVLDLFERLGASGKRGEKPRIRGRIEHAQLLATRDVSRFAELGIVASVQPEHAMDDRDIADRYWAGRTDRTFVLRSLLDAGAELALGSDAPVAPLDPWVTIAAAVDRSREGREPWHPEQAISVGEAMAASSRTRVAVGEPADLVITDLDPTAIDPLMATGDRLRSMPVSGTLLGGRWTHNELGG
ncbi:MAG: amidohydrolase [Microbacteriaceae bacterium]|nr:amidohydrolase [Microbacteriaceae bacterium]